MAVTRSELARRFANALQEGDAAAFVGAGLSRPSGFVDWRGLLRECALELDLDIDQEHDLVAVAQYYLNRRSRDRSRLNQIVKAEFEKSGAVTENHEILSRVPLPVIWTTNFDSMLEIALSGAGKTVDVKRRDRDLAGTTPGRDVVLYKMHGDITNPDEVIICKDDYERYARKHELFQSALEADLVSRTFLFLGFSFADPNLDYMLGHLRALLEDSKREHYAIMRRVQRTDFEGSEADRLHAYEERKQELRVQDLERYSIHTLLVDSYEQVTDVLREVEKQHLLRNVFISGSAADYAPLGEAKILELCGQLGRRLISEGYNIVTGVGSGIGGAVLVGALAELASRRQANVERRLIIRPFPQEVPPGTDRDLLWRQYREKIVGMSGAAVFIAGNKAGEPEASGVLEEFELARAQGAILIPLGLTGSAASRVWNQLQKEPGYATAGFRLLNSPTASVESILGSVIDLLRMTS
jgi:hypothetical protein